MPIYLQNLVRTIVDDSVTRSRTAISRHQNAPGKFESQNCGRVSWLPRSRFHRLLNALRHEKTYEQKFETQAARRAESLHQYGGFLNTCKNNGSEWRTRLSDKCPGGKISLR